MYSHYQPHVATACSRRPSAPTLFSKSFNILLKGSILVRRWRMITGWVVVALVRSGFQLTFMHQVMFAALATSKSTISKMGSRFVWCLHTMQGTYPLNGCVRLPSSNPSHLSMSHRSPSCGYDLPSASWYSNVLGMRAASIAKQELLLGQHSEKAPIPQCREAPGIPTSNGFLKLIVESPLLLMILACGNCHRLCPG